MFYELDIFHCCLRPYLLRPYLLIFHLLIVFPLPGTLLLLGTHEAMPYQQIKQRPETQNIHHQKIGDFPSL